jgi:hypothetical protein
MYIGCCVFVVCLEVGDSVKTDAKKRVFTRHATDDMTKPVPTAGDANGRGKQAIII